jgi:hypothetical protein
MRLATRWAQRWPECGIPASASGDATDGYRFSEPSAASTHRGLSAANIHEHAAAWRGRSRHRIRWSPTPEFRFGAP